jgi:transcriptional regulator with XRE-family HTH domain
MSGPLADDAASAQALPALPGFRDMARSRMELIRDLASRREASGLTQTQVAARMGTSQSAVARLEAGTSDVRASTLERYAAAVGGQIAWTFFPERPGVPPSG